MPTPIAPLSDVALTGVVSSGSQPVVGAHVYLLAANTTGYESASSLSTNASVIPSVSVIGAGEPGTAPDTSGANDGYYYVTTNANGQFSLTGDYACSSGQQLYLYSLGGNTGSGVNSAAGLMAVVGSCPSSSSPAIFVTVNEVSTVAAAYAFAGFAADATHVSSSGTALAQVGIANAFANAANLETLATGVALATTPAGNGTAPQAEINTLANVLAACVNTYGPGSGPCTTLLANALSSGTTETKATDTATAAINIAHSPGVYVASLYGLASSTPPFAPALSLMPNDFTLALNFTGGAIDVPLGVAIDGLGYVWIVNEGGGNGSVAKLSSVGAVLSGIGGYTGGGVYQPDGVAIDHLGNAWITNNGGNSSPGSVTELSSSGSVLSGANGYAGVYGSEAPQSIAIDGSGDVWVASFFGNVEELSSSGSILYPPAGTSSFALNFPLSVALDGSGSAWVPTFDGNIIVKLSSTGAVLSGFNGYSSGGANHPGGTDGGAVAIDMSGNAWIVNTERPFVSELSNTGSLNVAVSGLSGSGLNESDGIAIDGSGNAWIANIGSNSVTEISNSGSLISGANGYVSSGFSSPGGIAIDGSGDAWVTSWANNTVTELVGVATPVITPICAGLPATPTANGTSNLGTRP